jgi:hypothetical protein
MPKIMKRFLPLLLLGLSACDILPQLLGTAASAAAGAQDPAGSAAPITPSPASTPTNTSTASAGTTATTPTANKTVTIDPTKKLEYVNIWVDLGDPNGQRSLVPYLLKPEEWMLIKCEMLSPTSKHYTFQRVTTADGRSLPQVDIFKQGR